MYESERTENENRQIYILSWWFKNPLWNNRKTRKKIAKDVKDLNNSINQLKLIDSFRMVQPTTTECKLTSDAQRTFTKTDHIQDYKPSTKKFKRVKIIECSLIKWNQTRNQWRKILENPPKFGNWVTYFQITMQKQKSQRELENILKWVKMKTQHIKIGECSQRNVWREIYRNKNLK